MFSKWLDIFGNDLYSLLLCLFMLVGYHVIIWFKLKKDPVYTVHAVNVIARTAWVESIMSSGNKDVLAVQTLRNSTMGATFLASTAVILIIGTLNLSGQSDKLNDTWHALNVFGARNPQLWLAKLILLLLDFFTAFICFSMAIRLFNHVGYMINVPVALNYKAISPRHVAAHLNRAGEYHRIGMRAYYYSVPLVFWLFGPHFMVGATIALIVVLYYLDRSPKALADDYR